MYLVFTFCLGYGVLTNPFQIWKKSTSIDWYHYFRYFIDTILYASLHCIFSYKSSRSPNPKRQRTSNYKINKKKSSRQFAMRHLKWIGKTRIYVRSPRRSDVTDQNDRQHRVRNMFYITGPLTTCINNACEVLTLIINNAYREGALSIETISNTLPYYQYYWSLLRDHCIRIRHTYSTWFKTNVRLPIMKQGELISKYIGVEKCVSNMVKVYYEIHILSIMGIRSIETRFKCLNINTNYIFIMYMLFLCTNITLSTIMAGACVCYSAEGNEDSGCDTLRFDSDSVSIRIDNCCSRTISCSMKDFVADSLKPTDNKQIIRGFGNTETTITHTGTIAWNIMDDQGTTQQIQIPNSLYVPEGGVRLLSPQHWAQEMSPNDNDEIDEQEVWCITNKNNIILHWNKGNNKKTIKLDKDKSNTATMWSTTGNNNYMSFQSEFNDNNMATMCFSTEILDDDDYDDDEIEHMDEAIPNIEGISSISTGSDDVPSDMIDLHIQEDEEPSTKITPTEELLMWHDRLAHMPMRRIQRLAQRGILPKRLSKCNVPICPGCLYGKLTRRPWRTSKQQKSVTPVNLKPGEMVSVDKLQSNVPGFIAQMKGILTRQRYKIATVFVDHASDYTFVYMQRDSSSAETLKAKLEFERVSLSFGVNITRYHADNGRFVDNVWAKDATSKNQRMSLCGVNAHHQNGVVERRIRQLQDMTRTSLLQASTLWNGAINSHLWPYAMRKACEDINHVPHHDKEESPLELYSGVKVLPNLHNNHPFGCPVFVLDTTLQAGNKIPKWDARSRMGIYLGPLLQHASSVGLVLSLSTGNVSPAFHTKYDDRFITVSKPFGSYVPKSLWQIKSGLKEEPMTPSLTNDPIQDGFMPRAPLITTPDKTSNNTIPTIIQSPEGASGIDTNQFPSFNVYDDNSNVHDIIQQQQLGDSTSEENAAPVQAHQPTTSIHNPSVPSNTSTPVITRSGRISRPPQQYHDIYESILDNSLD